MSEIQIPNYETQITVSFSIAHDNIFGVIPARTFEFIKRGILRWDGKCATLPTGEKVRLFIDMSDGIFAGNDTVNVLKLTEVSPHDENECRDMAEPGGQEIYACILKGNKYQGLLEAKYEETAMHEFGHILGFRDSYIELDEDTVISFPRLETDVMTDHTRGGVYSYHLQLLKEIYP